MNNTLWMVDRGQASRGSRRVAESSFPLGTRAVDSKRVKINGSQWCSYPRHNTIWSSLLVPETTNYMMNWWGKRDGKCSSFTKLKLVPSPGGRVKGRGCGVKGVAILNCQGSVVSYGVLKLLMPQGCRPVCCSGRNCRSWRSGVWRLTNEGSWLEAVQVSECLWCHVQGYGYWEE